MKGSKLHTGVTDGTEAELYLRIKLSPASVFTIMGLVPATVGHVICKSRGAPLWRGRPLDPRILLFTVSIYPSTAILKYLMKNSRNKRFLNSEWHATPHSVMKSLTILLRPAQDLSHPFVQLPTSQSPGSLLHGQTVMVSWCLCPRHPYFT